MSNIVNIDAHKVEANDSIITGSNNIIFGNNNRIAGNKNKIYGNNNVVIGNDNTIKGEQNRVEGTGNDLCEPFGSQKPASPVPVSFSSNPNSTSPVNVPHPVRMAPSPVSNNSYTSMNSQSPRPQYPTATSPINTYPTASSPINAYRATSPINAYRATSPAAYQAYPPAMATSPVNNAYFQPVQFMHTQAMVPVAPVPYYNAPYIPAPTYNPFEAHKEVQREKAKDVLEDGTMVFMINEWESDYVREFCQLVSMTCGQQVASQVSCGRTCIVGLGDLEKIRSTIIELLPQLNMRLKEWSYNSFGKKVCSDRELFEKRLFKEYTREDVECWRNATPSTTATTKTDNAA